MKGILFKPQKIQFIAEHPDMEIQTRRLGGLKLINDHEPECWRLSPINTTKPPFRFVDAVHEGKDRYFPIECKPRYQQGETVYIKEAYRIIGVSALKINELIAREVGIEYKDGYIRDAACPVEINKRAIPEQKWHSPMMMPQHAARYFITITDVRVERVQEITTDDAKAEGVRRFNMGMDYTVGLERTLTVDKFRELWNSINAKRITIKSDMGSVSGEGYPWESNPWVWVYTFRLKGEK